MKHQKATYQTSKSVNGNGTFFFTDCCNHRMYSTGGEFTYHGKLCPKCLQNNIYTTLYLRGTEEANTVMRERGWNI